ncbi:MAG: InlB B-repeat-containing protein, partial [Alphaproteobacteria bacterium]|nr:InlB B-repeat-containing protein [Alphaproteobacteria bacterium]
MERFKKICGIFFALFITLFSLDSFAVTCGVNATASGSSCVCTNSDMRLLVNNKDCVPSGLKSSFDQFINVCIQGTGGTVTPIVTAYRSPNGSDNIIGYRVICENAISLQSPLYSACTNTDGVYNNKSPYCAACNTSALLDTAAGVCRPNCNSIANSTLNQSTNACECKSGYTMFGDTCYPAITLNVNGGTLSSDVNALYYRTTTPVGLYTDPSVTTSKICNATGTTSCVSVSAPTRAGYTFEGWYSGDCQVLGKTGRLSGNSCVSSLDLATITELVAKWTYTVTFKSGNTTLGTQTFTYGTAQNLKAVASMSNIPVSSTHGWAFAGWATSENSTTVAYTDEQSVSISGNTTLYGVWARPVTFTYYNGASATSTTTGTRTQYYYNTSGTEAAAGRVLTYALTEEHDNGWIAQGWTSTKDNATYLIEIDVIPSKNIELAINAPYQYYAVYHRNATLAYAGGDGAEGSTANTTKTQSFRAGNTYADTLTMTLDDNGFTLTGYSFNKWAAGSASGTKYAVGESYEFPNKTWTSDNTAKMYATWTAKCNKITLSLNGGTGGTTVLYKKTGGVSYYSDSSCSTPVTSVAIPKKNGSVFQGYKNESGASCITSAGQFPTSSDPCPVTGDTEWTAQYASCAWTAGANSTISAVTTNDNNQCSYTVECSTGHSRYGGVNTASEFEYDGTAAFATGNLPGCLPRIYTITLDDNGGSGGSGKVYQKYATGWSLTNFGTTISSVAIPTRAGYVFNGYYQDSTRRITNAGGLPANTTFTSNVTLKASWTEASCTKGTGVSSATLKSVTGNKPVCTITCTTGYSKSGGANRTTSFDVTGTAGVASVSGSCSAQCNVITLSPNGGTAGSVTKVYKKTGVTTWYKDAACSTTYSTDENVKPTRTDWTFRGFYLNSTDAADISSSQSGTMPARYLTETGATTTSGTNWTPTDDTTLYAGWARSCAAGNKATCSLTIGQTTKYTTGCNTGYNIKSGSGAYNPVCQANNWSVVFNSNRPNTASTTISGAMLSQSFTYDTAQNLTANAFSLPGYTFVGWATSASGSVAHADKESVSNLTTTNNGTVTLYAKWTANKITLNWNENGGAAVTSGQCTYDTTFSVPAATTRTGYSFGGWKLADDTVKSAGATGIACTYANTGAYSLESAAITAQWTANTFNVSYDGHGNTGGSAPTSPTSCTYAGTCNAPSNTYI